ncbi:MAG: beta-ketoacyl synthase chain length factor [Opitutales bacterium]|nr:beta-ketoacyl synthase chain length factor [Opitutales bacterium]
MAISFDIIQAAAWLPGCTGAVPATPFPLRIFNDDAPNTKGLALPIKRKLSTLSKSALLTLSACGNAETLADVPFVFSSRWGEWNRELNLLFERAETGMVSQGGFSLSVHNTVPSLFTLMYKNRQNYTAISAGTSSLEAAFLQAALWLKRYERVLLCYGEESAPELPGVAEKIDAGTLSVLIGRGNAFTLDAVPAKENSPIGIPALLKALAAGTPVAGTTIRLTPQ